MAVVFNEEGVADCKPPCVAQSFINHNAVLYKIYIVGNSFNISERPSLKNFSASGTIMLVVFLVMYIFVYTNASEIVESSEGK